MDSNTNQWINTVYKDLSSYEQFREAITEFLWGPEAKTRWRCALYQSVYDRTKDGSMTARFIFEGRPKGYKTPNYKIYKYKHSKGLVALFELEVLHIKRYIPPNMENDHLEIERTDYLPLSGCIQTYGGYLLEIRGKK